MRPVPPKKNLPEYLANSCIFIGLTLLFLDSVPIMHFMMPMNELTRADFLIAAGMIPHLTLGAATVANISLI